MSFATKCVLSQATDDRMDHSQEAGAYASILRKQQQLTEEAKSRKGEKPTNKCGRGFLGVLFRKEASSSLPDGHTIRTCFVAYAYPPSVTPLTELQPIHISDLRLETHHQGKVLLLRCFGHPSRIQAVQNAVEDEHGNVDRLALYNNDPDLKPEQVLPKGAICAVKEPFYKATVDGGYTIRVDHPSDLVLLRADDQIIPPALAPRITELDKSSIELKAEGNRLYGQKDFVSAAECYTEALAACSEAHQSVRYDLYRNRANANLLLGRFEPALADAQAAVVGGTDKEEGTLKLDGKAYYRAGRAAYELRDFKQASSFFIKASGVSPGDADAGRELKRTVERLREEKTGCYDFPGMGASASKSHNHLDHADFTANTVVHDAGTHGRGLFAAVDFRAGDLIMCEKAFSIAFESEKRTETYTLINLNTKRGSMGPHATMLFDLVRKLRHNPGQARRFFNLHDGGYTPKLEPRVVDGLTVIDTFRAEAISEMNRFGCPTVRCSDYVGGAGSMESDKMGSVGLWVHASHINHACDGNAMRTFIGDMMIIYATRDIKLGEEILMRYCTPDPDNKKAQEHTEKTWNFTCDCRICEAESRSSAKQQQQRRSLLAETSNFLSGHRLTMQSPPSTKTIATAESLRSKLAATYDQILFKDVPRLGLIDIGAWLSQAYNFQMAPQKVIDSATTLLGDLGYGVNVKKGELKIDYAHCCLNINAVDAAMYASHAYCYQGKDKLGQHFADFAGGLWVMLYAEIRGFEERYGEK